ncbi:N-acetyl sugar amidotransferase [Vibrio cholerae]|uniref:N-acetyl sugar amidotransferase n=1 Tax=Vibrio cholerae TaxID=666 RepID=UPI0011D886E9|nr:N-acetyl sugar amidotransferase [Vibrio cholerae]TXX70743.1 N-acetyl sugar amidotransferase [Vibrio cholerae]TXY87204.1 N-acetyl sugar amidotransferase [Vibrio cholerae]BCN17607.1 putative monosaccharide biosynthesis protein [Vibrio cholerae]BCN22190.1 putative monosaccharide biosynthesis protein [Vibrio cholerae]GIA60131.1 putative LPS biosynthesis protein [Vibrio cholerae]
MSSQICQRCIYDETVPNISFDSEGICNYCRQIEELETQFPNDERGELELQRLVDEMKAAGRGKRYDALIGVSGGCDSSYLMHLMTRKYGLRLLAVHFDNTWNTAIATENIHKVTEKLGIDLYTHVVDAKEFDDIVLSFLKAGVRDIECPTDIGLATTMNMAAEKFGIKYKIDGHSFRTEGSAPMGWIYMDAKYIQSVHKEYGSLPMKTFPNLWLSKQLKWMIFNQIKSVRPLYYLDYDKEAAKELLTSEYGWTWYGGHHLENRTAAFFHSYFFPTRWKSDFRVVGYSAYCRDGRMTREKALELMSEPPHIEEGLLDYYKKRLNLSDSQFNELMTIPKKYYTDFKNYKKTFERMRPFFYLMAKSGLIPWSFYIKYTLPHKVEK